MKERVLTSGAYRCDDCGHIIHITETRHVWALGARYIDDETFTARCPMCCPVERSEPKANRWNKFRRLGFWQTLKHVWHDTVASAKGFDDASR